MNARSSETALIHAALTIARITSPYSELAWIADIRAAVSHLIPASRVDDLLVQMHQDGEIVLERADMVQGVAVIAGASELTYLTETWHYAGPAE